MNKVILFVCKTLLPVPYIFNSSDSLEKLLGSFKDFASQDLFLANPSYVFENEQSFFFKGDNPQPFERISIDGLALTLTYSLSSQIKDIQVNLAGSSDTDISVTEAGRVETFHIQNYLLNGLNEETLRRVQNKDYYAYLDHYPMSSAFTDFKSLAYHHTPTATGLDFTLLCRKVAQRIAEYKQYYKFLDDYSTTVFLTVTASVLVLVSLILYLL